MGFFSQPTLFARRASHRHDHHGAEPYWTGARRAQTIRLGGTSAGTKLGDRPEANACLATLDSYPPKILCLACLQDPTQHLAKRHVDGYFTSGDVGFDGRPCAAVVNCFCFCGANLQL